MSYLVGSKSTKECFIIDPSQFFEEYLKLVKEIFKIKGVIETHVHADHISGAKVLAEITKTKYYVSGNDFKAKTDFIDLRETKEIYIGNNTIKVIETPGHTDGSVCLLINNKVLLTGDTLFLEGTGRPDLRSKEDIKKSMSLLFNSLDKLKQMDKNLIILPAHFTNYNKTPICEKLITLLEDNKTLRINSRQEFLDHILHNLPTTPPNYEQIKNININGIQVITQIGEKLELGPNRCASL